MQNKEKGGVLISLIIVAVIIVGAITFVATRGNSNEVAQEGGSVSIPESQYSESSDDTDDGDTSSILEQIEGDGEMAKSLGSYEDYSPEKIAQHNGAIIFFHASWCPTCGALNANLTKKATEIPDGVNILKANYDKEIELKKKYGVTFQHTLVQVDKDGNLIQKWSGDITLDQILRRL
jgi:thioredoxin 1